MKHKAWPILVLLVVAFAAGLALWSLRRPAPLQTDRRAPSPAIGTVAAGASSAAASSGSARAEVSPKSDVDRADPFLIPDATRETIARCLARGASRGMTAGAAHGPSTLDVLRAELSAGAAIGPRLLSENVHIRKADGQVLRLRVTPDEGTAARRVRMFSVDRENLPVPEELPVELSGLGPSEAVEKFRALGEVVYDARSTSQKLGAGLAANATEQNGRIVEMQVFFDGGSLGCAWKDLDSRSPGIDCRCL